MNRPLTFTAVGHLTHDALEQGLFPGGAALYAGLAARELGARVRLVTSVGPEFIGYPELERAGIAVESSPAPHTTHFEERFVDGRRWARVLRRAAPLEARPVEGEIIFLCPVLDEVARTGWSAPEGTLLAAGLQGYLRRLTDEGVVVPRRLEHVRFLAGFRVVFLSEEDPAADDLPELVAQLRSTVGLVVVTQGARGASLYEGRRVWHVPALECRVVDPTGAGDTFAACFLVALARGHSPVEAARWATCGAAAAISAPGTTGLTALREMEMGTG